MISSDRVVERFGSITESMSYDGYWHVYPTGYYLG
jgi:hypothetical protein